MDARLPNAPILSFDVASKFDTRDAAKDHISGLCSSAGITIVQGPSNTRRTVILCDRNGTHESGSKGLRKASSRKCNCPFKLYIRRKKTETVNEKNQEVAAKDLNDNNCSYTYSIEAYDATHNHPASVLENRGHSQARILDPAIRLIIRGMLDAGCKTNDIVTTTLAAQPLATPKDVYNLIAQVRTERLAGRTPIQALIDDLAVRDYFYDVDLD